uniref:Putative ovule protein n=1 Tax=Solanum chacoense TaxID=4108 RepID=A0A0V0GZF8_SOLCH
MLSHETYGAHRKCHTFSALQCFDHRKDLSSTIISKYRELIIPTNLVKINITGTIPISMTQIFGTFPSDLMIKYIGISNCGKERKQGSIIAGPN